MSAAPAAGAMNAAPAATATTLFPAATGPRLFALPPGADFPRALVAGLRDRLAGQPPEAMARVTILVNTRRMQRRIADILSEGPAVLLPRLRIVTDLAADPGPAGLPPPVPPLRRRLELAQLVARLIAAQPDLAPQSAVFDLAESLAGLIDEMQGEGVDPEALAALDLAEHAAHWQRTQAFLAIVGRYFGIAAAPDAETRLRRIVEYLAIRWRVAPPDDPVIVAGSTGSRGATARLMQAVGHLPQGALVLPGFDFDMPAAVWRALDDALTAEDHPQYRFHKLLAALGTGPEAVRCWTDAVPASCPERGRLISLSLRPAPVTDRWMAEGASLTGLAEATAGMTLIEAPTPRAEALAIALRLRRAAEEGVTAALITPDRTLSRQVTAALDRWGIVPDDSGGRPLALSAPGRFLRHVAAIRHRRLTSEALLTLLKHPLSHSGPGRGPHLLHSRDLELHLRRHGPPFPVGATLRRWADGRRDPAATLASWAGWLADLLDRLGEGASGPAPLADHVAGHLALAEALAEGPAGSDGGALWEAAAGEEARAAMAELGREAEHGGAMTAADYDALLTRILQGREVREAATAHPGIMIWGTLEARVQGADLVILGGLNDGVWPGLPPPDPWLNRRMRLDAGLLLPERRIGLSAHDYQQAATAREVVLTRAVRDAESETVPSRWINRLVNLLGGLRDRGGPAALDAMSRRGREWLDLAAAFEAVEETVPPAPRPAPRPPVAARPRELPVTDIRGLIRDPYAIYARRILKLRPLDPLQPGPDALLRGSVLHEIVERFVRARAPETRAEARARLMATADRVLADAVPWPAARHLFRARLDRVADWFLAQEAARDGIPVLIEERGGVDLGTQNFRLTAKPDRIDREPDGTLHVMDYKTGAPPSETQQKHFDKQLLLEAAMAERGGFAELGPCRVSRISYIGLGPAPRIVSTDMAGEQADAAWRELGQLIARYDDRAQGYIARRAAFETRYPGDYDHLARFGEWEMSDPPHPETVG